VGDKTFAIRVDKLMLKRPGQIIVGPSVEGTVNEVEYQGTYVRVAVTIHGGAEISAQLTESQFDTANYCVGERVLATWEETQASSLTRSSVTVPSPEKAA
jgi:putative spermidine/putrescine transport system ATP-binding protein